jgi:hypothetical protein
MEETMKNILSLWELRRYSRHELRVLYHLILAELASYPEGSFDQQIALTNLSNIRYVLATYHAAPH